MHAREKELQNLGLTEKESKVYLSSLELGEAPVQDIARKAGVNRATTYVMIEQLTAKGLMSSVERGKKRFFLAEAPDKLSTRVRLEITELEEKLAGFKRVLPDLHSLYDTSGDRPRVRFFEGEEGALSILDEAKATLESGVEMYQFINIDSYNHLFGNVNAHDKHKVGIHDLDYHTRQLYVGEKSLTTRHSETVSDRPHLVEARRLPSATFDFNGELSIIKNKIFILAFKGKVHGIIIESAEMAQLLRVAFDLAWMGAEKIKVEEHTHGKGQRRFAQK